jgi:hypothetical protein
VTADPPRTLSRGEHFNLAQAVFDALKQKIAFETRDSLLRHFGFETQQGQTWLDDLLAGPELNLLELGKYLDVPLPGAADDDLRPAGLIDAYSELVAAETAFREIVRSAIGPSWTDDFTPDKIAALEEKRAEEDKKRDGVSVSQDRLDYTEAYHLESLILKHWDKTGPILKDKKRTEVYLNLMLDVRNTIAHSRPVVPFERHLLAGIAGQIQNLISLHRSSSETADAYYASVNYVRDSFGDEVTSGGIQQANPRRLKIGQVVTFECSASDPYDRGIDWTFILSGNIPSRPHAQLGKAQGPTSTFEWIVTEDHVGESRTLHIMMSNDSPYKRGGGRDDAVQFRYHVSPPVPPRVR